VLAAAAGRVRCGACLNVFEAIDNFLIPEEVDAAQNQDESVFVGNNPQEYFDPASFLTRSALNETSSEESARTALIDEQTLHQTLEQSRTVSEEFFTTVAQELQEIAEAPALEHKSADEEPQINQPEQRPLSIANESLDEEFEDKMLDSFMAEATDAHEFTENDPADSPLEKDTEAGSTLSKAKDTHIQSTESFLGPSLSVSFTFDPAHRGARLKEPKSETSPDREMASEQPIEPSTAAIEDNETLLPNTQGEAPETDAQAPYESAPSSPSNDGATQAFVAGAATTESTPTVESSEALEPIVEAASTSIAEDKDSIVGATQKSAPEMDEDSTEAIRSRALEAELSDEEALETIPLENLAALGSMSTPVEFLARQESRLLRSSLLFLSILLFGGLLSSQYLWQRMELYSQLPQLRPLYEVACTYLNCTLPEFADIDSIRSENLTVQTHPTFANGLMVNTVIRNTATFKQAFPILILSFNSAENSIIALREFTPAEYLDPGLRSIQAMPSNTPVQISLAIMDPGAGAVNYTLAFRWP
tara:strand:+ start:1182 stop:2786 length:1605 start_codon:yes stop_codon:yes gene_type:complete